MAHDTSKTPAASDLTPPATDGARTPAKKPPEKMPNGELPGMPGGPRPLAGAKLPPPLPGPGSRDPANSPALLLPSNSGAADKLGSLTSALAATAAANLPEIGGLPRSSETPDVASGEANRKSSSQTAQRASKSKSTVAAAVSLASPTPPAANLGGAPRTSNAQGRAAGAAGVALAVAEAPAAANDVSKVAAQSITPEPISSAEPDDLGKPDAGTRRVARRRPAGPVRGRMAANDDAPSIGGLIYALEQKPSNRIYRYAAIASAVWALIGLIFAYMSLSAEAALGGWGALLGKPTTFLTGAAVIVPIAVIWFLAVLGWRAEELRLRSSTMTEVAIRLAEPDRMAEDSVASLGQAVRRQVSFMNEAVGRALGRAGELEALVHNEVAALERSYEENERRIRGLINELASERHALSSTSTSFNDTLRTLGREVPQLIEKLSNQQVNLAHTIQGAGQNLNALETSLAKSVKSLETELGGRTTEIKGVLEGYTGALGEALGKRTEDMHKMLEAYTGSLATALGSRTTHMQSVFEEYARALDTTLANRARTLDAQLVERTRALDAAFNDRLGHFELRMIESTKSIDQAVDGRAKALSAALENHARTFSETITRQSQDLDQSLNQGITAVRRTSENITRQSLKAIEGLAGQSDMLKTVSENLVAQIGSLTNRFEAQGHTIMKAANALESVNYKIDTTLQSRHAELSQTLDRMLGKADEFTRHVQDYSTTIEGTLSDAEARALAAAEQLRIGTQSHRQLALGEIERLRADTDAESARALADLKSRLANVSHEVSSQLGSLTSRFSETSEDVRLRAQRIADDLAREQARMREEAERLPQTTRESAEAMRLALQDQLRALDQLSSLTNREAQRRDVGLPVAHGGALKPAVDSHSEHRGPQHGGGMAEAAPGGRYASLSETLAHELGGRSGTPATGGADGGHRAGPAAGDAAASTWSLGDLLKRASDDERARGGGSGAAPTAAAGGAMFKLNIDVLARALDSATASAIWSRLRAGQRGIMVRSIYSAEGRTAFDEVARRFPGDPHLQATITRYIGDFERILRDSDAKDASGRLSQAHMTSTMGRVYLLLAHASGRIS